MNALTLSTTITGLIVSYCDFSSKMLCNTFIGIPLTYCYKIGISFTSRGLLTPDESWSESEKIKNKWQMSKNNFAFISCPFEHECSTNAPTKTCTSFHSTLYTCCYRPQRSCGKVMFLHLSISHSVHRRVSATHPPVQIHPLGRHPHWADTPGQTPPCQCILGYTPCPVHAGIHTPPCSACWDTVNKRRYASYWNAFLFIIVHTITDRGLIGSSS